LSTEKPILLYLGMKNIFLLLVGSLFVAVSGYTQEMNKVYNDPKLDKEVLIGYCDMDGLTKGDFGVYFKEEYKLYEAEAIVIKKIKSIVSNGHYEILTVFGDWCSDSQYQVPCFYKVLDDIDFPENMTKLIAVDRSKSAQDLDISEYDIQRVPTFIVYYKGQEIGRIIETPQKTLEKDLLDILNSKGL